MSRPEKYFPSEAFNTCVQLRKNSIEVPSVNLHTIKSKSLN